MSLISVTKQEVSRRGWAAVIVAAAVTIGWVWLSKTIVFTWAATDNLTELIADQGPLRLGGGVYLFAIVILLSVSSALLVRASDRAAWWPVALVACLATIPVGWWLLEHGLDQHVQKYGVVFSGQQFLLGANRQQTLSDYTLFLRWTAVEAGAILTTCVGGWIAHRCITAGTAV